MRVERRDRSVQRYDQVNQKWEEPVSKAKPYDISKKMVWEAYKRVKANGGAAGVDGQTVAEFEKDLKGNLYKIWNRMSSGSYFPAPVKLVEIPKGDGSMRPLGIPTVADRIAQMTAKMYLEPMVEPEFHPDSYGYRPGKSAHDAVGIVRKRCWRQNWVLDLDIKGFFDNLDHELMMRAVQRHTENPWLILYVQRWLTAPMEKPDGTQVERRRGTPQGGVVSPLLANLFMHHAFDDWMRRNFPSIQFARYADDIVIHCMSKEQAEYVLESVRKRVQECGLELHPEKTKLVYCKDENRRGEFENIAFDFLGFTFRPRRARSRRGKLYTSFLPAISNKSAKRIRAKIRSWRIAASRNNQSLEALARLTDSSVRGWMNYYGRFYRSECVQTLSYLNDVFVRWAMRKYKRFRRRGRAATRWLQRIAKRAPNLFVLWRLGVRSMAGR